MVRELYELVAPMWIEISFMLCFSLGFAMLRLDFFGHVTKGRLRKPLMANVVDSRLLGLRKAIESEVAAGNTQAALDAWRASKTEVTLPLDLLKTIVHVLVAAQLDPVALAKELSDYMRQHGGAYGDVRTANAVLDVVARSGKWRAMEELARIFEAELGIQHNAQSLEILMGGYAAVGETEKVLQVTREFHERGLNPTARAYSVTIKGFLKNSLVDATRQQITAMRGHGFHIPHFAATQFVRIACEAKRTHEALAVLETSIGDSSFSGPPCEAVAVLLEDCCKRSDLELASHVEQLARKCKVPLSSAAYDSLLKLHASTGSVYALELFKELEASSSRISEGLCVGLLARCAEAKFLRFAEEVVRFARSRGSMSIAMYSALMKVYAYCGMYSKACDLYTNILEDGLEPDAMMYGCLMKFSVECGRTELSRTLSEKAPSLDIQNYMSLIRAAGRDRDMDRAFAVLEKLRQSGVRLDIAAYNCVLDVCVSMGEMGRAKELVEEMRTIGTLDIVTYNTLLKGYCVKRDVQGGKQLLKEMERVGLKPNDVSYNCIINAAASAGDFQEAWATVDMMEARGIAIDHYTVSIMMKALKRVKNPKYVGRALALLDRSGLSAWSDEILLNTVLETCIRHREYQRLEAILSKKGQDGCLVWPSVHTYASLIKASGVLKRLEQCWDLWKELTQKRDLQPNEIVLGCMLDALVSNGKLEDAVDLFQVWKKRVTPNSVLYSTIMKGFANSHQAVRALETWNAMRADGIPGNTVVYNVVIDAQARVGAMEKVSELFGAMRREGCVPDVITYSTVVKGYCVRGDLDQAFKVFRSMQANNMVNDAIIYNTVLDGCIRHNRMDLADELLVDMEERSIAPSNFTLGILVKMYGRRRMLDKAFAMVEEVPARHGFEANGQVRTCLMCACINSNDLDRAQEVFEQLKAIDGADPKAYGALISGCTKRGQHARAVALVEEFYGLTDAATRPRSSLGKPGRKGRYPARSHLEVEYVEQLLQALRQQGLFEKMGIPLLQRLRAIGAPLGGRLLALLAEATS